MDDPRESGRSTSGLLSGGYFGLIERALSGIEPELAHSNLINNPPLLLAAADAAKARRRYRMSGLLGKSHRSMLSSSA